MVNGTDEGYYPIATTATIRSSAYTTGSTASTTLSQTSVNNFVSTPFNPTTVTSNSTPAIDDAVNMAQSLGCVKVVVAIGLGVGIPLIIIIIVLAVIIVRLKKQLKNQCLQPLTSDQTTPSKDQLQQNSGGVIQVVGEPYESLQPRTERTAATDGLDPYQALNHSTRTDI